MKVNLVFISFYLGESEQRASLLFNVFDPLPRVVWKTVLVLSEVPFKIVKFFVLVVFQIRLSHLFLCWNDFDFFIFIFEFFLLLLYSVFFLRLFVVMLLFLLVLSRFFLILDTWSSKLVFDYWFKFPDGLVSLSYEVIFSGTQNWSIHCIGLFNDGAYFLKIRELVIVVIHPYVDYHHWNFLLIHPFKQGSDIWFQNFRRRNRGLLFWRLIVSELEWRPRSAFTLRVS